MKTLRVIRIQVIAHNGASNSSKLFLEFGKGLATRSSLCFTTDILPSNLSSALPSVTNYLLCSVYFLVRGCVKTLRV